jgi:hypothetical protein
MQPGRLPALSLRPSGRGLAFPWQRSTLGSPLGDIDPELVVPSHPKRVEGDIMGTTAELLAADRVLDEAWRGGVGVAKAVALAKELSEIILREVVIEDAKQIISAHHDCDAAEAFARIVFVSHRTNRSIRDLACLVVASAAAELQGLAVHPPHLYRFTL